MTAQSVVTIIINGKYYKVGCEPGDEQRVLRLAQQVEEEMQVLVKKVGKQNENNLLVMLSLILADKAHEGGVVVGAVADPAMIEKQAAAVIERASERISRLASNLASQ